MKTQYIYYGIIAAIVVAIGVVVYLVWRNIKEGSDTQVIINDTISTQTLTQATADEPVPCTGYTRTSWLQDSSIRPGKVKIEYCDGRVVYVDGSV